MPVASIGGRNLFYDWEDYTPPWKPGEWVVFHHGYARSRHFWYEWLPQLCSDYRCLRFDMRGHGDSAPLGLDEEPTLEALAADVVALLDHVGIERAHFVGESLAGVVGIWLGAFYPERFSSVVLLSTPMKVSPQGRADFAAGAESWEAAFDRLTPGAWARQTMGHRFDPAITDPAYIEWAIGQAARTPVSSLRKYARLIEALDLSTGIPEVKVPTMLVAGGSKLAPPEQAHSLAEAIAGSRLEVLPDARHLVGYAMAEETAALARSFWEGLVP